MDIKRFKKRDNLTDEQAILRAGARKLTEFYAQNSNYMLFNNDSVFKICNEFENIINNIIYLGLPKRISFLDASDKEGKPEEVTL